MKNDGGSAFPAIESKLNGDQGDYQNEIVSTGGMSLRDYFAGQALQGILSIYRDSSAKKIAMWSYEQADEMLKARGEIFED